MSTRAGLRFFAQQTSRQAQWQARTQAGNATQRRAATTTAGAVGEQAAQSAFSKFFNSEVGPKTVHFWAPVAKWAVVLAGVTDFFRPAEKLSLTQNLAMMATGSIWTRWCFVIKPRNLLLAAVNFSLFCVGTVQVSRVLAYQASQSGSTTEAIKDLGKDIKGEALSLEKSAEKEMSKA